jgi:hypothetical protein
MTFFFLDRMLAILVVVNLEKEKYWVFYNNLFRKNKYEKPFFKNHIRV